MDDKSFDVSKIKKDDLQIPKTLIVDISANFGGANARVLALMKKFSIDNIALATLDGSMIAAELEQAGYLVHRVAKNKFDPRIPFRLGRIIKANSYRVVDTQNPQSKLWGSFAAFFTRAALISTLNSWYMNEHPKYSVRWFVYSAIEFFTNFALSRYIVVSREIQNAMMRAKIPVSKIDLIYNAVDLNALAIKDDRKHLLEKYNLPEDAILCLAAGRLAWAKAHDDLVDAVTLAAQKNDKIFCLIAGEGELLAELTQRINTAGMDKHVILPGHLDHDELLSALKASDIYVMPSRTEGTPVALLEAATLAKPIIASNVGGIPELVVDGEHALLVGVGNIEDLSQAILRVAGDVDLAHRLGQQARARVEANFSLVKQAQATAEAYVKACNKI